MFVRTASERDLKAVRALLVETWHDTYDPIYGAERVAAITDEWHSLPSLRARLEHAGSEFLLADDGTQIAGMAFAAAEGDGKTVTLYQLYVLPAFQGRGIGSMLLAEVEDSFPDAERLKLEVEEANVRAVSFYRGRGFTKTGETPQSVAVYERTLP